MYAGHGAVVVPYVPAIIGDSTDPVDELCLQVESFLSQGLLEDTMDEEEAEGTCAIIASDSIKVHVPE